MIEVYRARHMADAEILKDVLLRAGVPATVLDSPGWETAAASVWILRSEDLALAEAIVTKHRRPASGSPAGAPWTCCTCSVENEPLFDQCWNCGRARCSRGT